LKACARQHVSRSRAAAAQSAVLREALERCGGRITGADERLPNFATATFVARRGEDMLLALDLAGIAASSGSACASGSLDPSHVLLAMDMSLDEALGSLRLTTGYTTSDQDITQAAEVLIGLLAPSGARASQ
jgi:cysteine desulfurase